MYIYIYHSLRFLSKSVLSGKTSRSLTNLIKEIKCTLRNDQLLVINEPLEYRLWNLTDLAPKSKARGKKSHQWKQKLKFVRFWFRRRSPWLWFIHEMITIIKFVNIHIIAHVSRAIVMKEWKPWKVGLWLTWNWFGDTKCLSNAIGIGLDFEIKKNLDMGSFETKNLTLFIL